MDLEIPIDVKPIQDERIPESMWEKTYAAVLHVMMDDIMRCECLEKLSSVLAIGKQQTCDWLRGVWCLGKKYLPYDELKEQGMWFVCADMGGETMYNLNLTGPIGVVIGNEGEGVSRLIREKCDFVASIPMKGDIDSLNASVAAGVLGYEIVRQRLQKK